MNFRFVLVNLLEELQLVLQLYQLSTFATVIHAAVPGASRRKRSFMVAAQTDLRAMMDRGIPVTPDRADLLFKAIGLL